MFSNTEYFIVLHDVIDNLEYVFNTSPFLKEEALDAYHKVFRIVTKDITNKIVSYNILDEKCEIFVTEDIVSKGWLWNSNITKKILIFKMRLVPCYRKRILNHDESDVEEITNENENENEKDKEKSVKYGLGYANTLLFPTWRDEFRRELENKFKQMELSEE